MIIQKIPIEQINPAAYNPRKDLQPGDPEYEKLKRSMQEFGYVEPIVWNKRTGNIVGGHQRYKVLLDTGAQEIDCVVVELDDAKEKALNLALNKIQGDWDYLKLKDLLQELDTGEFDLELTGFDMGEIEDLMAQIHVPEEIVEDEVPEPPEEPITKPGDLWILGRHRLMCGDSTDKANVETLMDGNKADIAFTSPPYGVNLDYNSYEDTFENTTKLVELVLPRLCDITEDYVILNWGDIVSGSKINGTDHPSQYSWLPKYIEIMQKQKWYIWAERIWKKPHARCSGIWSASSNRPVSDWEYIFTWAKNHPKYNERNNGSHFGIIDSSESSQSDTLKNHPGAFPVYVASKVIEIHTKKNGSVVDLFGGTGTTLIACEQLNRTCYMMEIDPVYCDVIVERWENFTGQKAVLAE